MVSKLVSASEYNPFWGVFPELLYLNTGDGSFLNRGLLALFLLDGSRDLKLMLERLRGSSLRAPTPRQDPRRSYQDLHHLHQSNPGQ